MKWIWTGLSFAIIGLAGCGTTQTVIKPPKHPEEFVVPPSDDARFSSVPAYPKGTLNNDLIKPDQEVQPAGGSNAPGGGMPRSRSPLGSAGGAGGGRY